MNKKEVKEFFKFIEQNIEFLNVNLSHGDYFEIYQEDDFTISKQENSIFVWNDIWWIERRNKDYFNISFYSTSFNKELNFEELLNDLKNDFIKYLPRIKEQIKHSIQHSIKSREEYLNNLKKKLNKLN